MARSKSEAAKDKIELARILAAGGSVAGAATGIPIASPIGGAIGAVTGLIIGDGETVFPLDMVAIPAYQAYMINGSPSLQVYIRAGETLMPTGGNVEDVQEAIEEAEVIVKSSKPKKKKTARQRAYSKNFKKIAPRYKNKNGKWKKDGFKRCVKEAHRMCK